jgi:hypothetical protein
MVEAQVNIGPEAAPEGLSKPPRRTQKGAFSGFPFLSRNSKSQKPVVLIPVQNTIPAPVDTRHGGISGPTNAPAVKPPEAVRPRQSESEQGVAGKQQSGPDEIKLLKKENALLSKQSQEMGRAILLLEDMSRRDRQRIVQIIKIKESAVAENNRATIIHQEMVYNLTKERDMTAQKNSSLEEQLKAERRRNVKINIQLELERDRRAKAEGMVDVDKGRAKRLEIISDEKTQLLKTLKAEREAGIKKVNDAHSERDRLQQQLTSEQEAKNRLSGQLERERESRIRSEKQAEEVRLQLTARLEAALRNHSEDYQKQQELRRTVGCPVRVRHAVNGNVIKEDSLNKLTNAMIQQLKTVRETFASHQEVKRIDYIINDNLYKQFDEARSELRSCGRSGQEQLLFHGTNQRNINT